MYIILPGVSSRNQSSAFMRLISYSAQRFARSWIEERFFSKSSTFADRSLSKCVESLIISCSKASSRFCFHGSSSSVGTGFPHSRQNFASSSNCTPQLVQKRGFVSACIIPTCFPHSAQNIALSGSSLPQLEQEIATAYPLNIQTTRYKFCLILSPFAY